VKIVLSRKGFDSGYGGIASPILSDGTMLSFPIPSDDKDRFEDFSYAGKTYRELLCELKPNNPRINSMNCHLDPDIRSGIAKRSKAWKPVFGQCDAAETHLENQGIGEGDIFLFFGWFKKTESTERGLTYRRGEQDIHILYGFLQVGQIVRGSDVEKYNWHPHSAYQSKNNTMYVARDRLKIDGKEYDIPGAGVFRYSDDLVLTYPGMTRTKWRLPEFFRNVNISYHTKDSFKPEGYFQSAHKGQEFVVSESKAVTNWTKKIILNNIDIR